MKTRSRKRSANDASTTLQQQSKRVRTDGGKEKNARVGEAGYIFLKHFPGQGWYNGEVIEVLNNNQKRNRRCFYFQNRQEEVLTLNQLLVLEQKQKSAKSIQEVKGADLLSERKRKRLLSNKNTEMQSGDPNGVAVESSVAKMTRGKCLLKRNKAPQDASKSPPKATNSKREKKSNCTGKAINKSKEKKEVTVRAVRKSTRGRTLRKVFITSPSRNKQGSACLKKRKTTCKSSNSAPQNLEENEVYLKTIQERMDLRKVNRKRFNKGMHNSHVVRHAFWRTLVPLLKKKHNWREVVYGAESNLFGAIMFAPSGNIAGDAASVGKDESKLASLPPGKRYFTSMADIIQFVSTVDLYIDDYEAFEQDLAFLRQYKLKMGGGGVYWAIGAQSVFPQKWPKIGDEFQVPSLPEPPHSSTSFYDKNSACYDRLNEGTESDPVANFGSMFQCNNKKWPAEKREQFHVAMLKTNKDFEKVAKFVGKSLNDCFDYYYGTYKHSSDYIVFKQARSMGLHEDQGDDMNVLEDHQHAEEVVPSPGTRNDKKEQRHNFGVAPDPVASKCIESQSKQTKQEGLGFCDAIRCTVTNKHNQLQQVNLFDNSKQSSLLATNNFESFSPLPQYGGISRFYSVGEDSPQSKSESNSPTPCSPMISHRCARARGSVLNRRIVIGAIPSATENDLSPGVSCSTGDNGARPIEVVQRRSLRKRIK